MTLFEPHARLGQQSPQSTQYYARYADNAGKAYSDAGYMQVQTGVSDLIVAGGREA